MRVSLVQFRRAGKKYYFGLNNLDINNQDDVVVETIRGIEVGKVVGFKDIDESEIIGELKPIIRTATEEDLVQKEKNLADVVEVIITTKDLVKQHSLDMSILDAEYTLDRKRLLIYFEADERVDFRELVKDLSSIYQTRIELRQIGSRDGAKLVGGIGPCGLILCCNTFLGEFDVITIKMAKNQNISLNPSKISGACDKLLCCIKYENDAYTHLKEIMPDIGDQIIYEKEKYEVRGINLLKEKILIFVGEDQERLWLKKDQYERVK